MSPKSVACNAQARIKKLDAFLSANVVIGFNVDAAAAAIGRSAANCGERPEQYAKRVRSLGGCRGEAQLILRRRQCSQDSR